MPGTRVRWLPLTLLNFANLISLISSKISSGNLLKQVSTVLDIKLNCRFCKVLPLKRKDPCKSVRRKVEGQETNQEVAPADKINPHSSVISR